MVENVIGISNPEAFPSFRASENLKIYMRMSNGESNATRKLLHGITMMPLRGIPIVRQRRTTVTH